MKHKWLEKKLKALEKRHAREKGALMKKHAASVKTKAEKTCPLKHGTGRCRGMKCAIWMFPVRGICRRSHEEYIRLVEAYPGFGMMENVEG